MRTRFTCGAREFVTRWSECGPTHHFAAATGRHIDTILKVAKIFNVPVDIVTQVTDKRQITDKQKKERKSPLTEASARGFFYQEGTEGIDIMEI